MRYLTSKGLQKDAAGVKALTQQDIRNVENGIANVVFQGKHFRFIHVSIKLFGNIMCTRKLVMPITSRFHNVLNMPKPHYHNKKSFGWVWVPGTGKKIHKKL